MSRFGAELERHFEGTVTTLCHCWRLTRRDGTVTGFTDHDRALAIDGTLFEPQSGLTASEARETLGLAGDSMDVEGALSSDGIGEADIAAGRFDGATVETLIVNWREPNQHARLRTGTIGKITASDHRFVAELVATSSALGETRGRVVRRSCDAELGDQRCRFALDGPGFTGEGRVLSLSRDGRIEAAGLEGFADGWFKGGRLGPKSGASLGLTFRVAAHRFDGAGSGLWLRDDGAAGSLAAGDRFTVTAGCDKRFATCRDRFGNALNFRGFPHLPGNDSGYAYVMAGGVFDGGPLVP